jgi:hypothetical protein
MTTETLVLTALKEKNPALHRQMQSAGTLNEFAQERAEAIKSEIVTMTQAQRIKEKWDRLGPMECAAKMKMADAINREIVHSEMLSFPQES